MHSIQNDSNDTHHDNRAVTDYNNQGKLAAPPAIFLIQNIGAIRSSMHHCILLTLRSIFQTYVQPAQAVLGVYKMNDSETCALGQLAFCARMRPARFWCSLLKVKGLNFKFSSLQLSVRKLL
jgi:hypothetical protein